jgi:protein-arginine kinase
LFSEFDQPDDEEESEGLDFIHSRIDKDTLQMMGSIEINRDKKLKIIRKALKRFSKKRAEDAFLLSARILRGMSYEEIAMQYYQKEDKKKVINRLKKRFERAKEPLKKEIILCLKEEGLNIEDFFF